MYIKKIENWKPLKLWKIENQKLKVAIAPQLKSGTCSRLLLRRSYCGAEIQDSFMNHFSIAALLLRRSSIAVPRSRKGSATIRALLYGPIY